MTENKETHTTEEEMTFADVKRMKNEFSFEIYEDIMISNSKDAGNLEDVLEVEIDRINGYKQKCIENNLPTNIKLYDYMIDTCLEIAKKYNINLSMKKSDKAIVPIRLDATQTQIVYLFQKLIDENLINETLNPKLWNLVSQYFTDKDNKPLKNIHQTKDKLKNTKTGKPKNNSDIITLIVSDTKNNIKV